MRKNSKTANTIHGLIHQMMQGIESGNQRQVERAFSTGYCLDRENIRNGGRGYPLRWFVEIARQYPAALDIRPDIVQFIDDFEAQQRARTRAKRDFTLGYCRYDNPYCCYTQTDQYESWYEGWDEANRLYGDSLTDEELDMELALDDAFDD